MTEFELKLEVPADRLDGVLAELRQGDAVQHRLQARYHDTPDGRLTRHGVVVRLRHEGDDGWVQTAKAPGSTAHARLEHNAPVHAATADAVPALDLARHAGMPVGERIARALGVRTLAGAHGLAPVFETDVRRLSRTVAHGGSRIELALDQGELRAGPADPPAREPLRELEFELKDGDAADAVALARAWCARHGLWLGTATKPDKGLRLTQGNTAAQPVHARAPRHGRSPDGEAFTRAVLLACLDQVLGNAGELAAGRGSDGHVHQLRVGLRRLRTALRELDRIGGAFDAAWEPALAHAFRDLGAHRDAVHLGRLMQQQLEAAGGPPLAPVQAEAPLDPGAVVRGAAFQDTLLALLARAHGAKPDEADALPMRRARKIRKRLRARLRKLHERVLDAGERFASLDDEAQHTVRKRCKRLRYLAEFAAPLFGKRKAAAFLDALKPVHEALGVYNDERLALQAYRQMAPAHPAAWFGVGWLSARHAPNADACMRALRAFAAAPPFWD